MNFRLNMWAFSSIFFFRMNSRSIWSIKRSRIRLYLEIKLQLPRILISLSILSPMLSYLYVKNCHYAQLVFLFLSLSVLLLINHKNDLSFEHLKDLEGLYSDGIIVNFNGVVEFIFDKRDNGSGFSVVLALKIFEYNLFDLDITNNIFLLLPVDKNKP